MPARPSWPYKRQLVKDDIIHIIDCGGWYRGDVIEVYYTDTWRVQIAHPYRRSQLSIPASRLTQCNRFLGKGAIESTWQYSFLHVDRCAPATGPGNRSQCAFNDINCPCHV